MEAELQLCNVMHINQRQVLYSFIKGKEYIDVMQNASDFAARLYI